jgi:hypothetical protein
MAERDGAAVHVDLVLVDAQDADRVQGDGRERLVDLPEVDVLGLQAGLLERLLRSARGGPGEVGVVGGRLGVGDDLGERLLAVGRSPLVRGQHERARAVVDARGVARGVAALLARQAGELRQRLERAAAARGLVDLDDGVALAGLDGDGDDLLRQLAVVRRLDRELVRAQRPAVQVGARQLELVADLGRLVEHLATAERVRQAVVDHRIEGLDLAHPEALASAGEQVGGLRHGLHAAADADLDLAGADRLVQQHGRADAGGADLVDGLRGDLLGDAALDLCLARGDLALPRLEHLAHDHVLDLVGLDAGALERGLDRDAAELGGVEGRQAAAHLADRGAGGAEDHGLGH